MMPFRGQASWAKMTSPMPPGQKNKQQQQKLCIIFESNKPISLQTLGKVHTTMRDCCLMPPFLP